MHDVKLYDIWATKNKLIKTADTEDEVVKCNDIGGHYDAVKLFIH